MMQTPIMNHGSFTATPFNYYNLLLIGLVICLLSWTVFQKDLNVMEI